MSELVKDRALWRTKTRPAKTKDQNNWLDKTNNIEKFLLGPLLSLATSLLLIHPLFNLPFLQPYAEKV